jgi:hypothetical protein
MFELTMLGAILATVISLFVTTELPTRQSRVYDPQVSDGKILVAVEKPADRDVARVEKMLKASGVDVKRMV